MSIKFVEERSSMYSSTGISYDTQTIRVLCPQILVVQSQYKVSKLVFLDNVLHSFSICSIGMYWWL